MRAARSDKQFAAVARDLERLAAQEPAPACVPDARRILDRVRSRLAPLEHVPAIVVGEGEEIRMGFPNPGLSFESQRPRLRMIYGKKKPSLVITRLLFCRDDFVRSGKGTARGREVGLWSPLPKSFLGVTFEATVRRKGKVWLVQPAEALRDGVYCLHSRGSFDEKGNAPEFSIPFVVGGWGRPRLVSARARVRSKDKVVLTVEIENLGAGTFNGGHLVTTLQQTKTVTGRARNRATFRGRKDTFFDDVKPGERVKLTIEWDRKKIGKGTYYVAVGLNYRGLYDANRIFNGRSPAFAIR